MTWTRRLLQAAAALTIFAAAAQAAEPKTTESNIEQDITIKSKVSGGPAVLVPSPRADKAVVDEVIRSLDISRGKGKSTHFRIPAASQHLSRPFPEPPYLVFTPRLIETSYDEWTFEVFEGNKPIWRASGKEPLKDKISWDGLSSDGADAMRVEAGYYYRFTGRRGSEEFVLSSEPITLKSLVLRRYTGTHLEVSNSLLFEPGKSALKGEAQDYLITLSQRMRKTNLQDDFYRFVLYDQNPEGPVAKARATALRKYFSTDLVINPKKIKISVLPVADRGDVTVCILPSTGRLENK